MRAFLMHVLMNYKAWLTFAKARLEAMKHKARPSRAK